MVPKKYIALLMPAAKHTVYGSSSNAPLAIWPARVQWGVWSQPFPCLQEMAAIKRTNKHIYGGCSWIPSQARNHKKFNVNLCGPITDNSIAPKAKWSLMPSLKQMDVPTLNESAWRTLRVSATIIFTHWGNIWGRFLTWKKSHQKPWKYHQSSI